MLLRFEKLKNYNLLLFEFSLVIFFWMLTADHLSVNFYGITFKLAYLFMLISFFLIDGAFKILKQFILDKPVWIFLTILLGVINYFVSFEAMATLRWDANFLFNCLAFVCSMSIANKYLTEGSFRILIKIALFLVVLGGFVQYSAMIFLNLPIGSPQTHGGFYRINGLSFYPNFYNVYIFLFFPIILLQKKWKISDWCVLSLATFVLLQSTAKTGWVLFLISFISFGIICFSEKRYRRLIVFIGIIIASLLAPVPKVDPNGEGNRSGRFALFAKDLDVHYQSSGLERVYIAQQGLNVWKKNPILGVGANAYGPYVSGLEPAERDQILTKNWKSELYVHHENIWIETLSQMGLIGAIFFILIFSKIILRLSGSSGETIKLIGYTLLLYWVASGQFVNNILLTLPYVMAGMGFGLLQKEKDAI